MEMQSSTTIAMEQESKLLGPPAANRHRLPDERPAITHHFVVGGHEGYLTVGLYPNGQPGEDLHPHGQGRFNDRRFDGVLRDCRFGQPSARRAIAGALRQAVAHSF